jgi:hypothetical protein
MNNWRNAMSEIPELKPYTRKLTPIERMFNRVPYSIVTVVTRIKGNVSGNMLRDAVLKVQLRHSNLRVRIVEWDDHSPQFTSEGVKDLPIEIIERESDDLWIQVVHETSQIPFQFDERPPIRFILVRSDEVSELIILCHHIICDGMSLAYLARDLLVHLGDPTRVVEVLPDPVPIDLDNIPQELSTNAIVRYLINRINKKWGTEGVYFDQEDYEILNETYWKNFEHKMFSLELSEAQTSNLVARCRRESVTVNSALTTAFAGGQLLVQGEKPFHSEISVAGSLRDRLPRPAGECMGFFAGIVSLKFIYNQKKDFWNNVKRLHRKLNPLYTNKNLFEDLITWCYLNPEIMESISFKRIGGLVPSHSPKHRKISEFSSRKDVVLSILQREKMDSLDRVIMGTAVTNLTRLDFPRHYGPLELDRLIMNPGGAFPLVNVNLVLGAVTCAGKLSLVVEYAEGAVDTSTMGEIKDKALGFLLNAQQFL